LLSQESIGDQVKEERKGSKIEKTSPYGLNIQMFI
jgi:hypothetical protein